MRELQKTKLSNNRQNFPLLHGIPLMYENKSKSKPHLLIVGCLLMIFLLPGFHYFIFHDTRQIPLISMLTMVAIIMSLGLTILRNIVARLTGYYINIGGLASDYDTLSSKLVRRYQIKDITKPFWIACIGILIICLAIFVLSPS